MVDWWNSYWLIGYFYKYLSGGYWWTGTLVVVEGGYFIGGTIAIWRFLVTNCHLEGTIVTSSIRCHFERSREAD